MLFKCGIVRVAKNGYAQDLKEQTKNVTHHHCKPSKNNYNWIFLLHIFQS